MTEPLSKTDPDYAAARLQALLIEGLTTGDDIPLSVDFWGELKQDAAKILARNKEGFLEV